MKKKIKKIQAQNIAVENFKEHKDGSATFDLYTSPEAEKILKTGARKAKLSFKKYIVKMLMDYLATEEKKLKLMWNM